MLVHHIILFKGTALELAAYASGLHLKSAEERPRRLYRSQCVHPRHIPRYRAMTCRGLKHALTLAHLSPFNHLIAQRLRCGIIVLAFARVAAPAEFLIAVVVEYGALIAAHLFPTAAAVHLLAAQALAFKRHIAAALLYAPGEALAKIACFAAECEILCRAYLCVEFLSEQYHLRVKPEKRILEYGIALVAYAVYAPFYLQGSDGALRKRKCDYHALVASAAVMKRYALLAARLLHHKDILAAVVIVEILDSLVLGLLALLAAEKSYLFRAESVGELLARHAQVKRLLPFKQVLIVTAQLAYLRKPLSLLILVTLFRQQCLRTREYRFERLCDWLAAFYATVEHHHLTATRQMFAYSRQHLRHLKTLHQRTAIIIVANGLSVGLSGEFVAAQLGGRLIEASRILTRHSREVARVVKLAVYHAAAHRAKVILQPVAELHLLLRECLCILCAVLKAVIAPFVARAEVVEEKAAPALGHSISPSVILGIGKDIALGIVEIFAGVEWSRTQKHHLGAIHILLGLRLKTRTLFFSESALKLRRLASQPCDMRKPCLGRRAPFIRSYRRYIAVDLEMEDIALSGSLLGIVNKPLILIRKFLSRRNHLAVYRVDVAQTLECMVLILVAELVVHVHAGGSLAFLVLKQAVALIIDYQVEAVLHQSLVLSEVGVCRYHDSLALLLSCRHAVLRAPVVKAADIKPEVLAVIYPILHFRLRRRKNQYPALALLDKALHYAKTGISLTRARAVGKHVALAVTVLGVLMARVKELHLSPQHIHLLLRQQIRQSRSDILSVAQLHAHTLSLGLCGTLLFKTHAHILTQLRLPHKSSPLAHTTRSAVYGIVAVPHLLNPFVNLSVA